MGLRVYVSQSEVSKAFKILATHPLASCAERAWILDRVDWGTAR